MPARLVPLCRLFLHGQILIQRQVVVHDLMGHLGAAHIAVVPGLEQAAVLAGVTEDKAIVCQIGRASCRERVLTHV